MIRHNII